MWVTHNYGISWAIVLFVHLKVRFSIEFGRSRRSPTLIIIIIILHAIRRIVVIILLLIEIIHVEWNTYNAGPDPIMDTTYIYASKWNIILVEYRSYYTIRCAHTTYNEVTKLIFQSSSSQWHMLIDKTQNFRWLS